MDTLKPGTALFDGPAGPVLRDATGELFGVALPPEALDRVRVALSGAGPRPDELAAFARAGHLGARPTLDRPTVAVVADGPAADALTGALDLAGAAPVRLPADLEALLAACPAAVCAWHDGPAPAAWADLDVLADRGVAWQRISREGRHVLLEPIGTGHRDVRLRRLAAAGSGHGHLSAYWTGGGLRGDDAPDAAERALIAALAVKDLVRHLTGATPAPGGLTPAGVPPHRRLRVLDLDGGEIADHPVLPVPATSP
ncbi:hypothetical protein ACOBQX_07230 [Actinokineospora sp. G85]|uniref:hypothetical protein n=1 Tax=Actinokineospora sp. G85 TaxID=3406626 RepID=UPI003C73D9F4